MRLVGPIVDLLTWRTQVAETGVRLRVRGLTSIIVILGGLGAATGFAIVGRMERMRSGLEDGSSRSPE